jgi:hypothetical protein
VLIAGAVGCVLVCAVLLVRDLGRKQSAGSGAVAVAENHPPEIQSLELVPLRADLVARPLGRDVDGDPFRFQYKWTVAGRPQRTRSALLPKGYAKAGETVEVEATPVDSHGARGRPMRSSLTLEGGTP